MRPRSLKTKITTLLVAETVDFYVRHFGMVVAEHWDEPDDAGVILTFADGTGEAYLEIYRGESGDGFASLSLQFRTTDLDAFAQTLSSELPRRGPVERPWGSRYLYLTDPNGIDLIVYEGGL